MKKTVLILAAVFMFIFPAGAYADTGFPTGSHVKVVNCNEYISLRTAPSSDAEVTARIPLGTYLPFIGDAENGFSHVSYEGEVGYVLSDYLTLTEDFSGEEVKLTDDECGMTLNEAAMNYGIRSGDGFALIYVGDQLTTGKTFRMVRYAWNRE